MDTLTLNEAAVIIGTDAEAIRTDLKRNVISARKTDDRVVFEWEDLPVLSVLYVGESEFRGEARKKLFSDFHETVRRAADLSAADDVTTVELSFLKAPHHGSSSWFRAKRNVVYAFAAKGTADKLLDDPKVVAEHVRRFFREPSLLLRLSDYIVVDFMAAIDRIDPMADLYARGLERIETDPGRLGGEPVFKGTRLAVRQIGAMRDAGDSTDTIRAEYPYLSDDDVEFAKLYWLANPVRGRPPKKAFSEAHH